MCSLKEKFEQVRLRYRFYIDVKDDGIARTLSKRIEDLGLHQEVFLTKEVSHVIQDVAQPVRATPQWNPREGTRTRADAMLQKIQADTVETQPERSFITLTVQKAVLLLDKIYDTFFSSPQKANIRHFTKHFIKIEFLDKAWRPVYKEFDEWPVISLVPDPLPPPPVVFHDHNLNRVNIGQKMTRKSRPRLKEREEKVPKAGYCEMCNTDYADATLHRRSPHHLAFVRDHTNFLALDNLIGSGPDVTTFLEKTAPINGERRSLRKCNGDVSKPKTTGSHSPEVVNGNASPKTNGVDDEKRPNTRCSKRNCDEDPQYYKVIGVSTKLRSSGNFPAKQKESPPVNGTKPLVVKFRKVRRSELSVLSDEAEQFMFPKRASSTSSTSSDEEEEEVKEKALEPAPSLERRRLARPVALKEESSEEDSWPEDRRKRRRKPVPVVKKVRRFPSRMLPPPSPKPEEPVEDPPPDDVVMGNVSPLREEGPVEKCMKWEDGRLKYTPAVEQLEFAFESVPHSEPWFETFKRQDEDRTVKRNVPSYFSLYIKSPKLPYEIGQLPPLKDNCCPLSDLVRRDDKAGPSRSYGTRGMKKQKIKKRTLALLALESHPRKSPREHASTLAMLGSAGHTKKKNGDDTKSTGSEDTMSEAHCPIKPERLKTETQEESERLKQFLSEVFEDASEYEMPEEPIDGDDNVTTSTNAPDILNLVSECDQCEIIRDDIRERVPLPKPNRPRSKFKKKNRTGWPQKKKSKKGSRDNSTDNNDNAETQSSLHDDTTQDSISECEESVDKKSERNSRDSSCVTDDDDDKPLKAIPRECKLKIKREEHTSASEAEDEKSKPKKRRSITAIGDWLQPIVRVARVDPNAARKLRSAGRNRKNRKR